MSIQFKKFLIHIQNLLNLEWVQKTTQTTTPSLLTCHMSQLLHCHIITIMR